MWGAYGECVIGEGVTIFTSAHLTKYLKCKIKKSGNWHICYGELIDQDILTGYVIYDYGNYIMITKCDLSINLSSLMYIVLMFLFYLHTFFRFICIQCTIMTCTA